MVLLVAADPVVQRVVDFAVRSAATPVLRVVLGSGLHGDNLVAVTGGL